MWKRVIRLFASISVIPRLIFHRRFEDLRFSRFIEAEHNSARCACGMPGAIDRVIDGYKQRTIVVPLLRLLPVIGRDMWMFFACLDSRWNLRGQLGNLGLLELL